MAYKGQRSQRVKLSQSVQSNSTPLCTNSYLPVKTSDHVIHNDTTTSYNTRHVHSTKPAVPPKPQTSTRRVQDNKQSPGPVLSQALKLERFRSPEFNDSVTRTHAWVEEQTIAERTSSKTLQKTPQNSQLITSSEKPSTSTNSFSITHKAPTVGGPEINLHNQNYQLTAEKAETCHHYRSTEQTDTTSLRNACAKWFARDDITSVHHYVTSRQGNYVDLSRNIKSINEPDKIAQKETIGRSHQETSTKRRPTEYEDKSSSESGRGTMQSGMLGPTHHLDISLDSDHSVGVWKKELEEMPRREIPSIVSAPLVSHTTKPETPPSLVGHVPENERKDTRQRHQPIRNKPTASSVHKNLIPRSSSHHSRTFSDLDSTTTCPDMESLTIDEEDDVASSNYQEGYDMAVIRKQLEGLEVMYSEILRLLGVKSRSCKTGSSRVSSDYHHTGHSKRVYGSLSSLTGRSCSTYKEKTHHSERRRYKESRNSGSSKRLQRLECHVVNLARNVAHLSSEMRTQHFLVTELDVLRQDVTWVRDQLRMVQSSHSPSKPVKDWDKFRSEVLQILNPGRIRKLTKFFGTEPPLLSHFLKRLGYEKYASNFEAEKIGITELPYMNEEKLQKLGIPMGPRIRILQEAHLTFRQNDLKIYIV